MEALRITSRNFQEIRKRVASDSERNIATFGVSTVHPIAAFGVGSVERGGTNISSVSGRIARHVAEDGNMTRDIGSERNGFRHVLWSATMSNQFGDKIASRIGNAHEGVKLRSSLTVDFDTPLTQDSEFADTVVDALNNEIGRALGSSLGEDAPTGPRLA